MINKGELIAERYQILEKMISYFKEKEEITGIFISGSLAEGTADEYSDIDFRVIVDEKHIDEFIKNRLIIPENWGDLLYNEYSTGWKNMCVSHFKPFIKVDVFYYTEWDLYPSLWQNKGITIILDKKGFLQKIVDKSKTLTFEISNEEINILINKGLALVHEVYRRVMRNELIYANDLLNALRQRLIDYDDLLNENLLEGCSHYEKRGNKLLIDLFHESYITFDKYSLLNQLYKLIEVLQKNIQDLDLKYKLQRDKNKDLYSLNLLKDKNQK